MSQCPIDHTKYTNTDVSAAVAAAHRHQQDTTTNNNNSGNEQMCPIIRNVNDDEVTTTTTTASSSSSKSKYDPYGQGTAFPADVETESASPLDFEREFDDEIPSMRQYKKLKRTTTLITDFYRNGTLMKEDNHKAALDDLARLDTDHKMVHAQLKVLMSQPKYVGHLKWKDIKEELEDEDTAMKNQRAIIEKHANKCHELHEWSKGIVRICEWLEINLDHYCSRYLDLPKNILKRMPEKVPELTQEQAEQYAKGLDEIMHNLNESRDFFQAAVDSRLDKYYEIEKQMLEEQLQVLQDFPEDNPRREYVESSLREDLEHANAQLQSSQEEKTQKRRQFMLDLHLDFLKVLTFFKEGLKLLNATDREKREYDATFTTTFVVGDASTTTDATNGNV